MRICMRRGCTVDHSGKPQYLIVASCSSTQKWSWTDIWMQCRTCSSAYSAVDPPFVGIHLPPPLAEDTAGSACREAGEAAAASEAGWRTVHIKLRVLALESLSKSTISVPALSSPFLCPVASRRNQVSAQGRSSPLPPHFAHGTGSPCGQKMCQSASQRGILNLSEGASGTLPAFWPSDVHMVFQSPTRHRPPLRQHDISPSSQRQGKLQLLQKPQ